jgi:predicted nucleotidyltransferase
MEEELRGSTVVHGSLLKDKTGSLYSVIGIPPLPGTIIAFRKYQLCNDPKSIWFKGNRKYCRLVHDYTQYSILTHTKTILDPRFNTEIPIIPIADIGEILNPFIRLKEVFSHPRDPLEYALVDFLDEITSETGIELESWGVTGSILADMHNPKLSDIDLIVFGKESSERVFDYLLEKGFPRIVNWPNIHSRYEMDPHLMNLLSSGRSRFIWKGRKISITFIEGNIYHPKYCENLRGFLSWNTFIVKEFKRFRGTLKIQSNKGALTYPPCVGSEDYMILSFDHVLAPILYKSDCLNVDALLGSTVEGIDIVFLGVKERPVTKIKSC